MAARHKISENLRLVSTTYYQPNSDAINDHRAMEDFTLINKATEHLEFKISVNINCDSQPPQGIEQTDITYHTGLV